MNAIIIIKSSTAKILISFCFFVSLLLVANSSNVKKEKFIDRNVNSYQKQTKLLSHKKQESLNVNILMIFKNDQNQKRLTNGEINIVLKRASDIFFREHHKRLIFIIRDCFQFANSNIPNPLSGNGLLNKEMMNYDLLTHFDFNRVFSGLKIDQNNIQNYDLHSLVENLSYTDYYHNALILTGVLKETIKEMKGEYFRHVNNDELFLYSHSYYKTFFGVNSYDLILTNIPIIDTHIPGYSTRFLRGGGIRHSSFASLSQYNATGLVSMFPLVGNYHFIKDKSLQNLSRNETYDGISLDIARALSLSIMKLKYSDDKHCILGFSGNFSEKPSKTLENINGKCRNKKKLVFYDLQSALIHYLFKEYNKSLEIINQIEKENYEDLNDKMILNFLRVKIYEKMNDKKNLKSFCQKVKKNHKYNKYFDSFTEGKKIYTNVLEICRTGQSKDNPDLSLYY